MKLVEAIKILTKETHSLSFPAHPEVIEAEQLGIKALEYVLADRLHHIQKKWQRLEGETEE